MQMSEIAKIANQRWLEIPEHFPFVKLKSHIVMPNHLHGIVIIDKPMSPVETQNLASLQRQKRRSPVNKFGPQSKNLASVIRGFKTAVTKDARRIHADFAWQSRFYDHIIRNEKSFRSILEYIVNNPLKWAQDELYQHA